MLKKILAIFVLFVLCFSMVVSASAYTNQYVYDPDSHFSEDELFEFNSHAEKTEAITGYAIIFCIISDNEGMTNSEFAEETYYSFTDSENAVVVVHNSAESEYSWYVAGDEAEIFTDDAIETMLNVYDTSESYYGGLSDFYVTAEAMLEGVYEDSSSDEEGIIYTPGFMPVERTLPLVVDGADLLSQAEEDSLLSRCEEICSEYQMEIAILTVNGFDGKTAQAYADDFYDYNGYGYGDNDDGMLVLYKPGADGERELHITTHGKGNSVFHDSVREEIYAEMKERFIFDDCYGAFNACLDMAEAQLKPGVPFTWLLIFAFAGVVIGLIITLSLAAKNKTVVAQKNAGFYTRQGSMNIAKATDTFLYTHTSVKPKPQNNGGSGSSTHRSSSGRSHGGTGGRF